MELSVFLIFFSKMNFYQGFPLLDLLVENNKEKHWKSFIKNKRSTATDRIL